MWKALLVCLFLIGCTTTQYIPTEVTKTEYINTERIDSIYIRDSIFVKTQRDTVFIEKYKTIFRDRAAHDTIIRVDSIPVINTVEIVKEVNRIKDWQVVLMVLGGVFIAYIALKIKRAILP